MTYITPYLPKAAAFDVRQHENQRKVVVHRILQQVDGACKNCGGEGIVYLSFLGAGPSKAPITTSHPSTFVEKTERNGEGWYVIENTKGYLCPACSPR